ncbi:hypothetical protein ACWGHD_04260 [Streptomyces xanthophaeus]
MSHIMPAASGDTNPEIPEIRLSQFSAADRDLLTAMFEHEAVILDTEPDEQTSAPAIARLDVPLAQLSADLEFVRLKRETAERMKQLMVEDQQYDMHHLDADSACILPDCQFISYLPGPDGGQS